jgi:hypothetical protein
MNILGDADSDRLRTKFSRAVKVKTPRTQVHYQSGKLDYSATMHALLNYEQDWNIAEILVTSTPFGLMSISDAHSDPRIRRWVDHVEKMGLPLSYNIHSFPAVCFEPEESKFLIQHLVSVMDFGWDATLMISPAKLQVRFSHDDRIEIWAAREPRELAAILVNHGCST